MTVYVVTVKRSSEFIAVFGTFLAALRYVAKHDITGDDLRILPVGIAR